MATVNLFTRAINTLHNVGVAHIENLTNGFEWAYGHYIRANSSQEVECNLSLLGKNKRDTAVYRAITSARITGTKSLADSGIHAGWIGASMGSYKSAPDDKKEPYELALLAAVQAFEKTLIESGEFAEKLPLTEAEKAVKKQEKAEKAEKARADTIAQAIKDGIVVAADSVSTLTIADLSLEDLLDELIHRGVTTKQFAAYVKQATATV